MRIGIIGCGTVGTGVVELLKENSDLIYRRTGKHIDIAYVADRNVERVKSLGIEKVYDDGFKALDNEDVDLVVELIGGITAAKSVTLKAIERGMDVVTANKALLADSGEEIFRKAAERNVCIKFGASVGGGIPLIRSLVRGLVANRIERIVGIINGTANYVLSSMASDGIAFDGALERAKQLGYAESDPSLDINGFDSAHKIAILSCLSYCTWINTKNVYVKGIKDVSLLDVKLAHEFRYRIKLLAIAEVINGELSIRVHPTMIPENHILSNVDGNFNACLVKGDFVGETVYYGKGAGQKPTASAVVSDIVDIALGDRFSIPRCLIDNTEKLKIKEIGDFSSNFYLRFTAVDKPGVLARISEVLGRYNISIKMALQRNMDVNGGVPIVMTTHLARQRDIRRAILEIDDLDVILKPTFSCMIEELE